MMARCRGRKSVRGQAKGGQVAAERAIEVDQRRILLGKSRFFPRQGIETGAVLQQFGCADAEGDLNQAAPRDPVGRNSVCGNMQIEYNQC